MWTMSSASDSNWSPQPPNLQQLEKKEAAAMPVMSAALVHSPGEQQEEEAAAVVEVEVWRRRRRRRGQTGKPGPVEAVEEAGCRGPRVRVGGWSTAAAAAAAAADTDRAARQDSGGRSWEAGGGKVGVRMGGEGGLVATTSPAVYLLGSVIGGCHLMNDLTLAATFFLFVWFFVFFCTTAASFWKSEEIF